MNIVTTTDVFPPSYQAEDVLDRLARLGYTTLDIGLDYCVGEDRLLEGDGWRERVIALRQQADALGVAYTLAHAPHNVGSLSDRQIRSYETAALLGARAIVVHPIHEINGRIIQDADEFVRVNQEALRHALPFLEAHGLILLFENILWGASIHPQNIVSLVRAIHSPHCGWCFDTGHAHYYGIEPCVLRELDVPPLSLHIQDTHGPGYGDEHLLPGDGTIDWKEFLEILHEIGYTGDLVLEAHHQSYVAPDEEKDGILLELLERAKKMNAYYDRIADSRGTAWCLRRW